MTGERGTCCSYEANVWFAPGRGSLSCDFETGTVVVIVDGHKGALVQAKTFTGEDISKEGVRKLLEEAQAYRHSEQWKKDADNPQEPWS